MDVIQLRNPAALLTPEIQNLLKNAIATNVLLAPGGFDTLAEDLLEFITSPNHFMIVGAEQGHFKGVLMGYFPTGQLFPYPTVILLYNEGSVALRKALQAKYVDIMLQRGYTQTLAVNGSGRKDAAWIKALTPEGAQSEIVGSLMLMSIK